MIDQERDVLRTLAQGGQVELDDPQAVVEVVAKFFLFHQVGQVAVAGGDQAHVDFDPLVRAHAPDLLILDGPQQRHLEGGAHLRDLVEEHGAAACLFENAALVLECAGKGAAHVAEKLGLEQRWGEPAAVDGEEHLPGAGAVVMDRPRHQLFARAAFPADQHGGAGVGQHGDFLVDFDHPRTAAHQA